MSLLNLPCDVVGRRYPLVRNYLSATWIQSFAKVVSPEFDFKLSEVPFFFVPALRDGPFAIFDDLQIPLKRLIHVTQDYQYSKPVKAQEWLDSVSEVSELKEKTSKLGSIYILEIKTSYHQNGEQCFESVMKVFVRRD